MKVDVERAEGLAIERASRVLHRVSKIFIEFWPQAFRNTETDLGRLIEELILAGFKVSRIDEEKTADVFQLDTTTIRCSVKPSHTNLLFEMS
jgi:hypothetical protein